jgi:hypothetical protein
MTLDPSSVDLGADGVHRTGGDFALSWSHLYGETEAFYALPLVGTGLDALEGDSEHLPKAGKTAACPGKASLAGFEVITEGNFKVPL